MKTTPAARALQASFNQLPTDDPAAYLVWTTRTLNLGSRREPQNWQFHRTTCKGHTFHLGLLPPGILADWPQPPPSQWTATAWQLLCDFEPGGNMEFMSSLPFCASLEEAMAMAARRIAAFIQQKRDLYS